MDPDLAAALKALTDVVRLRIVGRLAAGPASRDELARELGVPLPVVGRHVALLLRVGLVSAEASSPAFLMLRPDAVQSLGRRLDELERAAGPPDAVFLGPDGEPMDQDDAKILGGLVADGRLTTIPVASRKREVVLRWLRDQVFTEDREYPEKEGNQRLGIFHRDVASLRRYMVDAGMVGREAGMYRRR